MNQARSEEEEKERKRKKRDRKTEARRLMERKAAQQNKNISEELKQGLPGTAKVNKAGGGTPNFPSHRMRQNQKNELISNESIFEYPGNLKFII